MVDYQHRNKCLLCKESFNSPKKRMVCKRCEKMKNKSDDKKLMVNNKKGNNRYTPKKSLKPKPVEQVMSVPEMIEKSKVLFREQWKLKRKVLSLGHQMSILEEKIFGYRKIRKDIEKEDN